MASRRLRVGMLIPEFPTQTHVFYWREIEALRALDVDVNVVSTKRPSTPCPHEFAQRATAETHYVYPPRVLAVLASIANLPGLLRSLKYIGSLSGGMARKLRMLGHLLCAMDLTRYVRSAQIDHVHVHSCADAAHVVAMSRFFGGVPYSLHLHGDLPVYGTDHAQKMASAAFVSAAARPMQRQVIEQAGVPEDRTYTMWMGVDTARFQPAVPAPMRTGPLHLVTVGRLHHCKGHKFALQALRRVLDEGADIVFTIAGSGPHEADIAEEVRRGEFGDRVRMVGSLGESDVLKLLRSAHAFVLSSIGVGEASPVAVMEAMAAGVPAICSIIGGTADMIADGVDGLLVRQEDVEGLAESIRRIYRDEAFRQELAGAARRRAVSQFDSSATAARMLAAIRESAKLGAIRSHAGG